MIREMRMAVRVRVVRVVVVVVVMADLEFCAALLRAAFPAILAAIPPVLDGVVAAAAQPTGNLRPALAHFRHHLLDQLAFFGGDGVVVEVGFEVLVVSLAALLGGTRADSTRDLDPVLRAVGRYQLHQQLVLDL